MITIFDVANAFLALNAMTHKKLQKLCYYAQSWHLALQNRPLFNSKFQAWIHGPVAPELYSVYRGYAWTNIEQRLEMPPTIEGNEEVKDFILEIFRIYGGLSGDQLEILSHKETPWLAARGGLAPWDPSTNEISEQIMREFYLQEYERSQND